MAFTRLTHSDAGGEAVSWGKDAVVLPPIATKAARGGAHLVLHGMDRRGVWDDSTRSTHMLAPSKRYGGVPHSRTPDPMVSDLTAAQNRFITHRQDLQARQALVHVQEIAPKGPALVKGKRNVERFLTHLAEHGNDPFALLPKQATHDLELLQLSVKHLERGDTNGARRVYEEGGDVSAASPQSPEVDKAKRVAEVMARMRGNKPDVSMKRLEKRPGYISERLDHLRKDAAAYHEFDAEVKDFVRARREAISDVAIKRNIRNVMGASQADLKARQEEAAQHEKERQSAARHRTELATFLRDELADSDLTDADRRRQSRHEKRAVAWLPILALAPRLARFAAAKEKHDADVRHARYSRAAIVIQRRFRLWRRAGIGELSPVRAFLVRARFLRRVLTRVRVKLREMQVERICNFVNKIHYEFQNVAALLGIKRYFRRIRAIQRHFRTRSERRRCELMARREQWRRWITRRDSDLRTITQVATNDTDAQTAAHERHKISLVTDEIRDKGLSAYQRRYLQQFEADCLAYKQAVEKQKERRAQRGGAPPEPLPEKPRYVAVIPSEVLASLVREAIRRATS